MITNKYMVMVTCTLVKLLLLYEHNVTRSVSVYISLGLKMFNNGTFVNKYCYYNERLREITMISDGKYVLSTVISRSRSRSRYCIIFVKLIAPFVREKYLLFEMGGAALYRDGCLICFIMKSHGSRIFCDSACFNGFPWDF